jgi:hypothetical protein
VTPKRRRAPDEIGVRRAFSRSRAAHDLVRPSSRSAAKAGSEERSNHAHHRQARSTPASRCVPRRRERPDSVAACKPTRSRSVLRTLRRHPERSTRRVRRERARLRARKRRQSARGARARTAHCRPTGRPRTRDADGTLVPDPCWPVARGSTLRRSVPARRRRERPPDPDA